MLSFTKSRLSATKAGKAGKIFLQTLLFFLLVTQFGFGQWVQLGLDDKGIKEIAARNSTIFAVTTDSALYRSTDNGINWLQIIDSGATDIAITPSGLCFMIRSYSQFIWEPYDSLYRSSDNGNTWINLNIMEQLPPPTWGIAWPTNITVSPIGFVFCGLFRFEGDEATSFAMSTDEGSTWIFPGWGTWGGDMFDFRGQSVITSGYFSWGSGDDGWTFIYWSSDNGQTWLNSGWHLGWHNKVLSMCLNGNIIMEDSWWSSGLFLSADSCQTWTQISPLIVEAGLSIESGGTLVGTDSLGIFLFSDNGDSIGSFNEGLSNLNTHTLSMDNGGYVYVGTDNGMWRRPLSEIIPVELSSFTATTNGKEVILNWSTATELNNQGFEIQKSEDNISFNKIGFVPGFGTTTEPKSYSYSDQSVNNGKYYYRLKQVDYDGSYEYSDVVEIEWRVFNSYLLEQNFPNPFNPKTTIEFGIQNKSNVKITILNAIGEEVAVVLNEEREAGFHQVELNAANLPSGVYFYQLRTGLFVETKKMILLK